MSIAALRQFLFQSRSLRGETVKDDVGRVLLLLQLIYAVIWAYTRIAAYPDTQPTRGALLQKPRARILPSIERITTSPVLLSSR